jgi:hypothetical protein
MTQTTVARVPINKRSPLVALKPDLNIDGRIAAAFGNKVTSADVVNLITDVELALIEAGEASNLARAQALSPLLSMDEVAVARQLMTDAQFRQSRLEIAIVKLRERLAWLGAQEADARNQVAYDAAKAERDKLAEELADIYPEAAQRIAELLHRIVSNDAMLEQVNRKLPNGKGALLGAELVARNLQNYQAGPMGTSFVPRLTQQAHLPAFQYDPSAPYLWPIRRTIFD